MEFQAVSGPKFTGLFSSNARGIAIVCNVGRFWISSAVPEIFAIKVWSGPKSTEILHVFGLRIFFGECPPNFWTCIIKLGQIPTMWQSFRAIGRGNSENTWRKKRKKERNITSILLPRNAKSICAVLGSHVVCLSVCNVGDLWSHRLQILETNCKDN